MNYIELKKNLAKRTYMEQRKHQRDSIFGMTKTGIKSSIFHPMIKGVIYWKWEESGI